MADYNIKNGGTKTTGSSADWTDSECYGSFNVACTEAGASDIVVLDDDTIVFNSASTTEWGTSKVIQSRSGDPNLCTLHSTSVNGVPLNFAGAGTDFLIKNIKMTRATQVQTIANASYFRLSVSATDLIVDNCILGNYNTSKVSGNIGNGVIADAASGATRNITFRNGTIIENMTMIAEDFVCLLRNNTDGFTEFNDVIVRNLIKSDLTNSFGWIRHTTAGSELRWYNSTVHDLTSNGTSNGNGSFLYNVNPTSTLRIYNATTYNMQWLGSGSDASFAHTTGPYHIDGIIAYDNVSVQLDHIAGRGSTFLASSASAQGSARRVNTQRCVSNYGPGLEISGGAGVVASSIIAKDNTCFQGAVYFGGDGDASLKDFQITDNIQTDEKTHAGLGLYAGSNNPTRDRVFDIQNGTIVNNTINETTIGIAGIQFFNDGEGGHRTTITVKNLICRNDTDADDYEIFLGGGGSAIYTESLDNCNIQGGTAKSNMTNTNVVDRDPEFVGGSDYRLTKDSSEVNTAIDLEQLRYDARGKRRRIPYSMGGLEPVGGDPIKESRQAR